MSARRRRTQVNGLTLRGFAIPSVMVVTMLVMGIIFGSVGAQTLDPVEKSRLVQFLGRFSQSLANSIPAAKVSPQTAIITNLQKLSIIWVLAVTVIGAPAILAIVFLQGFATGFTVAILVSEWSMKGLLLGLASVVPHNVFLVGGLVISSVGGLTHAWASAKSLFVREATPLRTRLLAFSLICLICAVILIVGGLIEAYLSPFLVRKVAPLVF